MRIGYFTGKAEYADFIGNELLINIPRDKQVILTLITLYSGRIRIKLGANSRLLLSAIDMSKEENHSIDMNVDLSKDAKCITTFNFKGESTETKYTFSANTARNSHIALNTIMGHQGKFTGVISTKIRSGAHSLVNCLIAPLSGSTTNLNISADHIEGNSSNSIELAGYAKKGDRVDFEGKIYVPKGLKDVETRMNGRFLGVEGASVHALPILSIYSRDVRASHGISVANLSIDELNYMQSRGIALEDAYAIVEQGLLSSMLNKMAKTFEL